MKADVAEDRWANFFDDLEPDSPECLPLPDFLVWLRRADNQQGQQSCNDLADKILVAPDILDFFEQVALVASTTKMFWGPDSRDDMWSLATLPTLPPPKAMIEFVPGPAWDDFELGGWETGNTFLRWREDMRPIAQALETVLGEPVYHFKALDDELDDDDVHRFLVLHWCCTYKPDSDFVRYLLRVSGARDVEALKAALIDPTSYTQPFTMNRAFRGLEVQACRFNYPSPEPIEA